MKLLTMVLAASLSLTGLARADELQDPYGAPPPRAMREPPLRRMIMERFDRNHDGRLEPRERRQAVRALRRIARRLAKQDRQQARLNRVIRKYDLNGDGNVGPGEMPPAMARRLRPLDRDGNGWVDDADFAGQ